MDHIALVFCGSKFLQIAVFGNFVEKILRIRCGSRWWCKVSKFSLKYFCECHRICKNCENLDPQDISAIQYLKHILCCEDMHVLEVGGQSWSLVCLPSASSLAYSILSVYKMIFGSCLVQTDWQTYSLVIKYRLRFVVMSMMNVGTWSSLQSWQ